MGSTIKHLVTIGEIILKKPLQVKKKKVFSSNFSSEGTLGWKTPYFVKYCILFKGKVVILGLVNSLCVLL